MLEENNDKTQTHVTLTSGTMVSHYRIIEKIGAGGMGEVYLAEDTNLNRQIAIKVLPDMFGSDQERLARFEREAKLLASLNHPNLATIHGLENVQGKRLLVMELVEGDTLAERIVKGPLPLEDALDVFRQIAAGMEAAHEKGIIHRDLKPANIKITPEGKVKILDFGLAKALHGETVTSDLANSPTITENMTRAGVILGTAAYMSPEQAKGKSVDKRGDIWAFGCIVYECLTGRRAFEGETTSETLAAILRGEPDWEKLPPETPAHIRSLLHRCLQKDSAKRLRDVGDAILDVSELVAPSAKAQAHGNRWRTAIPWIAFSLMVAVATYYWYLSRVEQPTAQEPIYTSINPPENSVGCFRDGVALSPDGSKLAFVSLSSKGERLVWVRSFDRPDATSLPGTDGGTYPFWSPDSKQIAFYASGWLKRVPAKGGPVQTLCRAAVSAYYGGSWGRGGRILFCDARGGISNVAETGGDPTPVPGGPEASFPCFLDDGNRFLYARWLSRSDQSLYLSSLDERGLGIQLKNGSRIYCAERTASDYLVIYHLAERSVAVQRLNISGNTLVGSRSVLADLVPYPNDWPVFTVSQTGKLAYLVNPTEARNDFPSRLVWYDRKGNPEGSLGEVAGYWWVRISPNGHLVIYSQDEDVRVLEIPAGRSRRVTNAMDTGSYVVNPVWSPTGDQFAAVSDGIRQFALSGGHAGELISDSLRSAISTTTTDWSGDAKYVLCDRIDSSRGIDVAYVDLNTKQFKTFVATRANEQAGHFSPDGRWVAYVSDETGSNEVYIRSFPGGEQIKRVSTAGGMHPRWRDDGKELFYLAPGWTVMTTTINFQPELRIGTPVMLFQTNMADLGLGMFSPYDVTPDGQHFLVIQPQAKPVPLTLVQNWQALVGRK